MLLKRTWVFGVTLADGCQDLNLEAALGVWEELVTTKRRPSRQAYQAIIDACVAHPTGIRQACELMVRMRADGYSLKQTHHDTLILGFRQARNLEAALQVYSTHTPVVGSSTFQVGEEMMAALLESFRRSGDAVTLSDGVALLCQYGVTPPDSLMKYVSHATDAPVSDIYRKIFGTAESQTSFGRGIAVELSDSNMRQQKGVIDKAWGATSKFWGGDAAEDEEDYREDWITSEKNAEDLPHGQQKKKGGAQSWTYDGRTLLRPGNS